MRATYTKREIAWYFIDVLDASVRSLAKRVMRSVIRAIILSHLDRSICLSKLPSQLRDDIYLISLRVSCEQKLVQMGSLKSRNNLMAKYEHGKGCWMYLCSLNNHRVVYSCHYCSYSNYAVSDGDVRRRQHCYGDKLLRFARGCYLSSTSRELEVRFSVYVLVRWDMRRIQSVIEHSIDQTPTQTLSMAFFDD